MNWPALPFRFTSRPQYPYRDEGGPYHEYLLGCKFMLKQDMVALAGAIAVGVGFGGSAEAVSFHIDDFNNQLSLNGSAQITDGVLRLTPDQGSQAGSAFLKDPISISLDSSWSTFFSFRIHGERAGTGEGADGLAFVVQNDPRGDTALGTDGSGLGYGNGGLFFGPPIQNSLAISLDTFPSQFNGEGDLEVLENGSNFAQTSESLPFDLADGNLRNTWIEYDGESSLLNVFLSDGITKPTLPKISYSVDIASLVGSQAYFGFTASTGARFNIHQIEEWSFSLDESGPESVPEPASLIGLVAVGVVAVGGALKKKASA
jgi:hypothetical protein